MFDVNFFIFQSMSHIPQSTSRDTNDDEDNEEGGGENRGTNEDRNVGVIDPTVVPDLDVDIINIQGYQEELSVGTTVDALEVPIEDDGVLIVPMNCSDVEDGVSPYSILPFDELQTKEFCFNIQSLTSSTMIEPLLDMDTVCKIILGFKVQGLLTKFDVLQDNEAPPQQLKRKNAIKFPPPVMQRNRWNRFMIPCKQY